MENTTLRGKSEAENPHVAPTKPRRGFLSCKNAIFAGVVACAAGFVWGEGTATYDASASSLTLDGLVTNITAEADLGAATNVVLKNGGGVVFGSNLASVSKTYSIAGDGLSATGVLGVASDCQVSVLDKNKLSTGSLGHVLVKRGAGVLRVAAGPGAVSTPTRWIVEEGCLRQGGADFFGNHKSTTTNLTLEVRAGGTYQTEGSHCPIGPLVLVGGKAVFNGGSAASDWGATALRGGVVAKACETESLISISGFVHLNHEYVDVPFVVEEGAILNVSGRLVNGWNTAYTAQVANRLVVSGGGLLRLFGVNTFSGGTKIGGGTTVLAASAQSLGTSKNLEIDGAATLDVPAGTTLADLVVTGAGTLTKTGAGVMTTASVAEGVTIVRAEGEGTNGTALGNGVLYLNGGTVTVNVPAGETLELTNFTTGVAVEFARHTGIVKTGDGTLVLPNQNSTSTFRTLEVTGGRVQIAAENNLGSGSVTLKTGGQLAFTGSITSLGHYVSVSGEGGFDVPEGVSVGVTSNSFNIAKATFHKTGAGSFEFLGLGFFQLGCGANATIVADEGTLTFNQDPFGGHSGSPSQTVVVNAGATVALNAHVPVGHVVMRGGTIRAKKSPTYKISGSATTTLEDCFTPWDCSLSCNGLIEVQPSTDGSPSVIEAPRMFFAHASNATVIDVAENAVLKIEGGRLDNGRTRAGDESQDTGFIKRGAGELVWNIDAGLTGPVLVERGIVTMGAKGRLSAATCVQVLPGATLRLADKSVFGARLETDDPFLATADVWMDATRLQARMGASVSSVPNYGTAGGSFMKFTKGTIPTAPVFTNGINGLSALYFDGGSALVLNSYTNLSNKMTVFMVADWTSWDYNNGSGGKGHWGGGLSMSSMTAKDTDNAITTSFHTETAANIHNTYVNSGLGTYTLVNENREVGMPYLDEVAYTGERFQIREYVGPETAEKSVDFAQTQNANLKIDLLAIGGRLSSYGACQYAGTTTSSANRMYIGCIGELLVFARALTSDESLLVRSYLKRKWFSDATATGPTSPVTNAIAGATVDVPSGAEGGLGGTWTVSAGQDGATAFALTGEGTLKLRAQMSGQGVVDVTDGTLELSNKPLTPRADVWFDATDAETVEVTDGQVTSVANKGRTGGVFAQAIGRWNSRVPYPTYEAEGLCGMGAVAFDWNSGLMLSSYTNSASRSLQIYLVAQRTKYAESGGKGKWSGPFSFVGTSASCDDQGVVGASHIEETLTNRVTVYTGSASTGNVLKSGGLNEPYLFVMHQSERSSVYAYEWADTVTNGVTVYAGAQSTTCDVQRVILGGRGTTGGAMQWQSKDHGDNRTWAGRIGELIVCTSPLSVAEEAELLAYLRAKWFAKGGASTTPPAFLSGNYGAPTLASLGLKAESGASIVQAGPTLALASLVAADGVSWTRAGTDSAAAYALFDVTGALSFGSGQSLHMDPAPDQTAKLFGGAVTGPSTKWTFTGDHSSGVGLSRRADGLYLLRGLGAVIYLR